MEARQFYTRSLSPLVTKSFAVKWSDDDRLAIVTKEGVHVLKVIPAPSQATPIINLQRSFIRTPGTLPCERYVKDVLDNIFDWPKDDVYSFLMNEAYTPSFPKATKPKAEICDVYWSPRDLLHPHGCLIALLTSGGGLVLAVQIDRSWFSVCNVSEVWADAVQTDYEVAKASYGIKLDGKAMKDQMDRLFVTSATWSCIYEDVTETECFAYLVTAHRNSELAVWQVNCVKSENLKERLSAEVKLRFNSKLVSRNTKISSLLWVKPSDKHCLLVVGFHDGQVGVLKLHKNGKELKFDNYSTCYPEQDLIPVESLHVLRETDKWLELVIVKGMHLVTLVIDIHGKMISIKFVTSPGFCITGTTVINSDIILITTQDGQFCEVKKSYDQQELICKPISINPTEKSLQYLGLACSPNRVLFALVTSPSGLYDHLFEREPSSVIFFSLNNLPSTFNPLSVIHAKNQSLHKCWDCLNLVKVNALRHNEPPSNLSRLVDNFDSMQPHELRAAYWLMTIAEVMHRKNGNDDEASRLAERIEQSRLYLSYHSACDYLGLLQRDCLTDLQRLSISILKTHLDIWLAGEEAEEGEQQTDSLLMQRVREALETFEDYEPEAEKCSFCNELVLEPWSKDCPNGHKLYRCAITCLQVTSARYRSCLICEEIFHPCLDEDKLVAEVRCPYCDMPAVFKNEVINDELRKSPKNLSNEQSQAEPAKDEIVEADDDKDGGDAEAVASAASVPDAADVDDVEMKNENA